MKCDSTGACISGKNVKIFTNSFSHAIKISKTIFDFELRFLNCDGVCYSPYLNIFFSNGKALMTTRANNRSSITLSRWIKFKDASADRAYRSYITRCVIIFNNLQCLPFSFFLKYFFLYFFIIEHLEHPFLFLQNQQLSISSQYHIGIVGGFLFILQ